MLQVELLVVGGGPAGLSASRAAARQGAKVLCVERKRRFGSPVQCAEGVGASLLSELPIRIPKQLLEWPIRGFRFRAGDLELRKTGAQWRGFSVNRSNLEPWLAEQARRAGAEVISGAEVVSVHQKAGRVVHVAIRRNGKTFKVKPGRVIAADGAHSLVASALGLRSKRISAFASVCSFELSGIRLDEPSLEHVFFGPFAPTGYAYIFPKGRGRANVGCGSIGWNYAQARRGYRAFTSVPEVERALRRANVVREKSGVAAIANAPKEWCTNNVLLTGDAANQNLKPFVEGILPAIIMGDYAGRYAARASELDPNKYSAARSPLGRQYAYSSAAWESFSQAFRLRGTKRHMLQLAFAGDLLSAAEKSRWTTANTSDLRSLILRRGGRLTKD